jgi:hypothetical protein
VNEEDIVESSEKEERKGWMEKRRKVRGEV